MERKKKTVRKIITVLLCFAIMALCLLPRLAITAAASETDVSRIDFVCKLKDGSDAPVAGRVVRVYQLGTINADGTITVSNAFSGMQNAQTLLENANLQVSDDNQTTTRRFAIYFNAHRDIMRDALVNHEPLTTGADGFTNVVTLAKGYYLVSAEKFTFNDIDYRAQTYIAGFPLVMEDGTIYNRVTVNLKPAVEAIGSTGAAADAPEAADTPEDTSGEFPEAADTPELTAAPETSDTPQGTLEAMDTPEEILDSPVPTGGGGGGSPAHPPEIDDTGVLGEVPEGEQVHPPLTPSNTPEGDTPAGSESDNTLIPPPDNAPSNDPNNPSGGDDPTDIPLDDDGINIDDEPIPLADAEPMIDIPDENVPLSDVIPATDIPDEPIPLANLPQTGLLWWPVPIMAIAGLLLFIIGVVKRSQAVQLERIAQYRQENPRV